MQDMDILTAAITDETSVYKTPPEVQKSEVVIAKQQQVSWFFRVSPQRLWSEVPRKKCISATWKMSNLSVTCHHKHCHRTSTSKLMTSLLEDPSPTLYVYLYEYIDIYIFIFIWIFLRKWRRKVKILFWFKGFVWDFHFFHSHITLKWRELGQ